MHRFIQPRRLYSTARSFAPGFEPPVGSRETPKIVPKRRNPASSLPSHLGNAKKNTTTTVTTSPKKHHREQLRQARHEYAQELLTKHGKREATAATKRAENEERMQQEKQALAAERQHALEREAQLVNLLNLDLASNSTTATRDSSNRQAVRDQNRVAHQELLREQRRKELLKLYSSAESFVTLENLDAKIEAALSTKPHPSYHTSLEEYILTSTSESSEVERRKEVIKEAMGL
ncbi:hypothetical protein BDB00DRAFT_838070 [Zychaea mexicana]|uniref:uncharacterized protein n=1 Tax=Zychaea mexicana TaxID=64656 RepID=UPI0022FEA95D|nr:uncharacterized protein BDB00DRAFT_838070 [Zychaea mexicana]KAI9490336.1 hypothetical protein BDB00DRAFT_838070 [Zychaea mexicana]